MLRSLTVATAFVCASAFAYGHASLQNISRTEHFLNELKKGTDAKKGANVWYSASFQNGNGSNSSREKLHEKFFSPISFIAFNSQHLSIATFGSDYYPAKILGLDSRGIVFGRVIYGVAPPDAHVDAADKVRKYAEHKWKYTLLTPNDCRSIDRIIVEIEELDSPSHERERVVLDKLPPSLGW